MPTFFIQTIIYILRLNDCLEYYYCFHTLDNRYLGAFSRIFHEHLPTHAITNNKCFYKNANYKGKIVLDPLSMDRISEQVKDYYTTCVQQTADPLI